MEKIKIDGQWYRLIPEAEAVIGNVNEIPENTPFYSMETPDGVFTFTVLEKDGESWDETQALTWKPKNKEEGYWDSLEFLLDLKSGKRNKYLPKEITDEEFRVIVKLLNDVGDKGWL